MTVAAANSYVDLIAGGYDKAIRAHELALDDSALISRVDALVAGGVARLGQPKRDDLGARGPHGLDALYFGAAQGEPRWTFSKGATRGPSVRRRGSGPTTWAC